MDDENKPLKIFSPAPLPGASQAARVELSGGLLSGFDVAKFGELTAGVKVRLNDGRVGDVIAVQGKRLTAKGVLPGSIVVRFEDGNTVTKQAADITEILTRPE